MSEVYGDGWLITYPDLPGCISDGETAEEAIGNGRVALESWIEANMAEDTAIPTGWRPQPHHRPAPNLIGRRYNREKLQQGGTGANQYKRTGKTCTSTTAEKPVKENNTSPRTVKNYAKDAELYDPLQKEKPDLTADVRAGETTRKDVKLEQSMAI